MSVKITTHDIHSRRFPASKNLDELVVRLITRLFGCQHLNMSMPITCGGETHRTCVSCGARRNFDANNWSMYGSYYFTN
jgi:hypothetical protein